MTSGALSIKPLWITDPHLDHLQEKDPGALDRLGAVLDRLGVTHILLGGDIADSRTFADHLRRFAGAAGRPIFFVLGNHDYYFSSVASMEDAASSINIPGVTFLHRAGTVDLGGGTALLGRGGWGDARCGDMEDFVVLTDYAAISDLAATIDLRDFWVNGFRERNSLVSVLQRLGEESAAALEKDLDSALFSGLYSRVLILTHVSPFRETCTRREGPGDDRGYPAFLWNAMSLRLVNAARNNPGVDFLVLSGHTHSASYGKITGNLRAWSSYAEYGELCCRVLDPQNGWEPGESIRI
jgi:predicted phosphodiesterase